MAVVSNRAFLIAVDYSGSLCSVTTKASAEMFKLFFQMRLTCRLYDRANFPHGVTSGFGVCEYPYGLDLDRNPPGS